MDDFDRTARLYPALLVMAQFGVGVIPWFLGTELQLGSAVGLGGLGGFAVLASAIVRDRGRKLQEGLYSAWGGKPTTQLIVAQMSGIHHSGESWSANLKKLFPNEFADWSTKSAEQRSSTAEQVVARLKQRTHGKEEFKLLRQENKGYNFRRNLWGMKPAGLFVASLGLLVAAWGCWMRAPELEIGLRLVAALPVAVLALAIFTWLKVITPKWVRAQAFRYAQQLLASTERLLLNS